MFNVDSCALKHHNYNFPNVQERQKLIYYFLLLLFFKLFDLYEILTHHYRYVFLLHICYLIKFHNIVLFCLTHNYVDNINSKYLLTDTSRGT